MNKQGLMQTSILKEYAKSHKYKVPTYRDFQEKCMKYFGVSLHQEAQDYEVSIDHNSDYTINELCRFIYVEVENLFYQPKIEREVTAEDAQKLLYAKENGIADKFIAYNKLLFNDDISTLSTL